ncbi:hypothetical protein D3C75_1080640 [compost metagenome]
MAIQGQAALDILHAGGECAEQATLQDHCFGLGRLGRWRRVCGIGAASEHDPEQQQAIQR